MKTVYVLVEDFKYGAEYKVFSTLELAKKGLDEVFEHYEKEYGKAMDRESLADHDIYVSIETAIFTE